MEIGSRVRANTSNLPHVYGILVEASAWLRQRGLTQWNREYPLERFTREVEAGYVWYWAVDSEPIATVTLHPHRPEYYPEGIWEDGTDAWYICRFAVARRLAQQGVGRLALASVEQDAKAQGIQALRLDVTANNPFLTSYYANQGFQLQETVRVFGEPTALLQKALERAR